MKSRKEKGKERKRKKTRNEDSLQAIWDSTETNDHIFK